MGEFGDCGLGRTHAVDGRVGHFPLLLVRAGRFSEYFIGGDFIEDIVFNLECQTDFFTKYRQAFQFGIAGSPNDRTHADRRPDEAGRFILVDKFNEFEADVSEDAVKTEDNEDWADDIEKYSGAVNEAVILLEIAVNFHSRTH